MNTEKNWHAWRKRGVGASEAPLIYLGELFGKTSASIYIKKLSKEPYKATSIDDNPDFRRGHTYEPLAAKRFEEKTGIKVFYPADDVERYGPNYCIVDPDHKHRRVSLDGICEDGWILEIKSPRQYGFDKIKTDGLKDYYQIQSAYQAGVAQRHGTIAWAAGKCKGVRLCVWDPGGADIMVVDLPYDEELCDLVNDQVDTFWNEHVLKGIPPQRTKYVQPIKKKGGKYVDVDAPEWIEAGNKYRLAKDSFEVAKARMEIAKTTVVEVMEGAQLEKIKLPSGIKFLRGEQAGRKSIDMELLAHENPGIDLSKYEKQGKPFKTFNAYGIRKAEQSELDENVATGLAADLARFVNDKMEVDEVFDAFDDLRSRTEMMVRYLEKEKTDLEEQLTHAATAAKTKMFGGTDG